MSKLSNMVNPRKLRARRELNGHGFSVQLLIFDNLIMPSVRLKIHKDIEIIIQTIATALIIYLLFTKKNGLLDSMNNRFFKYTIFLAVSIGLSTTLFLMEFEKNNNNNFLLAQEQEKPSNYINNKNLQSSPTITINSNTNNNFKESIPIEELNEISTISNNHNDYASELTIHIPKRIFSSCNS